MGRSALWRTGTLRLAHRTTGVFPEHHAPTCIAHGCCAAQVAVQSFGVCREALRALSATTEAVELHTDKVWAIPCFKALLPQNMCTPLPDGRIRHRPSHVLCTPAHCRTNRCSQPEHRVPGLQTLRAQPFV